MKLSIAHQQMLEDGCPKACFRENTPEAQEAVLRLRKMASQPPQIRISHPKDVMPQAAPAPSMDARNARRILRHQDEGGSMARINEAKTILGQRTSKREIVAQLLLQKEGCTREDMIAATGWKSVSVVTQAKEHGIALRKVKEGNVTKYFGSK